MKLNFTQEPMPNLPGMMTTLINGKPRYQFAAEYLQIVDDVQPERHSLFEAVGTLDSYDGRAVFVAAIEAFIEAKMAPGSRGKV